MSIDIKIPTIGESIKEVTLTTWLVEDGQYVNEGDNICEIESEKASMEMPAEQSGIITIVVEEDSDLEIGAVIASIDETAPAPSPSVSDSKAATENAPETKEAEVTSSVSGHPSPAAKKILAEKGIESSSVSGTGKDGRITKNDAAMAPSATVKNMACESAQEVIQNTKGERVVREEKMSRMRKTIAMRLVEAKNTTAMLTTFNEVDMKAVMDLRTLYKESFKEKHGIGLGFMSFFTKACTMALNACPAVNAQINDDKILYHDYADIGIAVSTPKGLVVPVLRNAESLSMADIEKNIRNLALKGRDGKLTMDEMQGGTFTITNGGVFGSMLSTPIINVPQSAILGMHNIVERPVAIKGEVVIRPIMYVALSYDHRIVDGKDSVTFLKTVKELIEDPARLLLDV